MYLFADDMKILKVIRTEEDKAALQHDIDSMWDWTDNSLLKFHPDKYTSMHISRGHNSEELSYSMGHRAHPLQTSSSEKDMGVTIDHRLQFEELMQGKINKANSVMGLN